MERTDFEQWKGKEVARLLALVDAERRYYQEMVTALPVSVAVLSPDRSIILVNRAFRQTFGLRADEVRGKTIDQILPSQQLIEKIRAAHVNDTGQASLVLESVGKRLRIDISPLRSWDEEMELETLLAIQDVSGQDLSGTGTGTGPSTSDARAGEIAMPQPSPTAPVTALAKPGTFSAQAFPSAELPAIVWQADAGTLRFTAVSGAGCAALGYPTSHWLESEGFFEQRIHADDRDALALYRSIFKRGGEASAEFRILTFSGEPRWCRETVVAPAPGEEPRKVHGVLAFIDERVRLQGQKEAAARHSALNGLSAHLAHDLNNPLMVIAGYAEEMVQAFPEGDPRREEARHILSATERISEVTLNLVRFTRRGATRPAGVDMAAALAHAEPKLTRIGGKSVAVRIEPLATAWGYADSRAIEDVLVALAGAACTSPKCTKLHIVCEAAAITERIPGATLAPGAYTRITVQANGRGLDPEKSASIFESILSKSADNTNGAGLAQAYGLVREWGGDIAYSGGASHSTFVMYLRSAKPEEAVRKETPVAEAELGHPLILVVDDEPGIRALVAKILRRDRYEVIEASSATEAGTLAIAQARPIDLLVTDVMLPDRSGPQLAEELREVYPKVKILYISGYTEDESVRTGAFPSGAKFLQKPFTLGTLIARVRESLGQV